MNLQENVYRIMQVMGLVLETREGYMNYLRTASKDITGIEWPEYVLRDWLYRNTKDTDGLDPQGYKGLVRSYLESFMEGHGKGQWEYKVLDVSLDIFTEFVQEDLKKKMGGFINPDINKDEQRHATQQDQLEKQGISPEPIIVVETRDGKYDLLEGWHRTTNALKKYGEYKQNAWVYVLDNNGPINEDYTLWVKRRMDMIRKAERETSDYMTHKFKQNPQQFTKSQFINVFFSTMMDELHDELSKGGSEDFNYSRVHQELRDSLTDYVEELWIHLKNRTS